jgi:transglutaminase-like putative cysteine protease
MGNEHEAERPPRSRAALLIALLALDMVAAAAFGRVFRGPGTALRLVIAAAACVLLAGLLERQHILLTTMASAVGLAVAVGLMAFPETTWHGLFTPTTLRSVLRSWEAVGRAAASEVAPALPLRPLILASLTAVWAAAFSSHALAARAHSPFLAILPPGALVAFATLLMDDGPRPAYVVPFLVAALLVLYADGLRRVGQWGPVTVWNEGRGARFAAATSTRGARRVALACVAVALFMPGVLPGFRAPGLIDVHADSGPTRVSIDPLVDIRARLIQREAVTLFTVRSHQAAYWRSLALAYFDGRRWLPSPGARLPQGVPVQPDAPLTSTRAGASSIASEEVVQQFSISRLVDSWLPAAYDPIQVTAPGQIRYDPETSTLLSPEGLAPGYTYTVVSRATNPTSEELDRLGQVSQAEAAPFLQLPADLPPEVEAIAHRLTDDQPTAYLKIVAIQQHLRGFRYDLDVPPSQGVDDLVHFLTVSKAGYCQQFAGAMAVLLRSLGIPARVAVGFTQGRGRDGAWTVTTHESHAWVEVLFPTYGWLAFEPTPTRYNPRTVTYATVRQGPGSPAGPDPSGECRLRVAPGPLIEDCSLTDPRGGADPAGGGRGRALGETAPAPLPGAPLPTGGRPGWLLPGGLSAIAFLILLIPLSKSVRRRVGLGRVAHPRRRVLAAQHAVADQAADYGYPRRRSETFQEYRTRLTELLPSLRGDLDGLTVLAGQAAYSEAGVSADQAREATRAARAAIRDLRRGTARSRRIAGWFRVDTSSLRRWTAG